MCSPKLFRLLVLGGALLGQSGCGAPKDPGPQQMTTDDGMMQQNTDGGGTKPDLHGVQVGGDDGGGQPMW